MSFATTSTPGGYSYGTQDNSRQVIPADPIVSSMTTIFAGILAERGRSDATLITTSAGNLYGAKTFEKGTAWFHHSNLLITELAKLGIPLVVKRFIPENAKKAMLRISLELIATDLPKYERNSDGSIKQTVDPLTGLGTPISNGVVQGTRAVIHVGVGPYALENREPRAGNVIDDYRSGATTINGKFLGEITRADGSKEHPSSRLFPLMDLVVDSEGAYGNNIGLVIETPTIKQVNPVDVNNTTKNRAFALRVGVVERDDQYSTAQAYPKLDGDLVQDVFLKAKATDYISGKSRYFAKQLIDTFNRKPTATDTPIWGPFGDVYVYDKNVNEIQQILCEGYIYTDSDGSDITIAGEASYDDDAFDYGRTTDHKLSNPLNYGYFNFLSGRDLNNVPYFSFNVNDSLLFGGVSLNSSTTVYASGGDDGLWYLADGTPAEVINLKLLDDAYRNFLNNFGTGPDKLKDILRYPITGFIDSGWSLDTKLAHSNILAARPDIHLEIGTQSVIDSTPLVVDIGPVWRGQAASSSQALSSELLDGWDFQPRLTGEQDEAIAVRLRTHFGLTVESVFFGTPTMRVHVFGHSGYDTSELYDHPLPGSYDRGLAMAQFTGVTRWEKADDFTENDNRKPRFLKEMSYEYREETDADTAWSAGLNFLRSHDIVDDFWPAVQSIYPHKDSVLNNAKFVLAASKCHYFGMEVWRSVSGENKTDAQFKQDLEDEATRLVSGRFTDDVRIVPEAILTDADKARGYSGYLKFHIGIGSMRTKLTYSVHGYTLDQLNEMQGLAP